MKQFKTGDYTADLQSIGQRLQQQREGRQLTRETVAQELKLHLNIVTALEEGDMQHLPGPTFIMGYLRSYARLLDIPTEEVTLYSVHEVERSARLRSSSSLNNHPLDSRRGRRLFLILLVVGLLAATAFWWFTQPPSSFKNIFNSSSSNPSLPPGPQQLLEDTMLPRLDQMNEVKPELVDVEGSFSALPAPTPATTPSAKIESLPAPPKLTTGSGTEATTTMAALTPPTKLTPPPPLPTPLKPATPPVAATPPPPTTAPTTPLRSGEIELRLVFRTDSWTEVHDAIGERRVFGIQKQGSERLVKGKAPFQVFLGFAEGVDVFYNGKPYDHNRFQRKGMARFELGGSTPPATAAATPNPAPESTPAPNSTYE